MSDLVKKSDLIQQVTIPGFDNLPQAAKAEIAARTNVGLLASMCLRCRGDRCPYAETCPIIQYMEETERSELLGARCPIETTLVKNLWISLSKSLDVNEEDETERILLMEFIRAEISSNRAANLEAVREPISRKMTVKGSARTFEDVLDPSIDYSDKIANRKFRIMNLFLATRKAKVDANKGMERDPSIMASKAKERWKEIAIEVQGETVK